MKELERQQLQDTLHKDVMRKIIFLQRWFRAHLQRKEFLDMRQAAILIQVNTDATIIFWGCHVSIIILFVMFLLLLLIFMKEFKYNTDMSCPVTCTA